MQNLYLEGESPSHNCIVIDDNVTGECSQCRAAHLLRKLVVTSPDITNDSHPIEFHVFILCVECIIAGRYRG